MNNSKKTIKGPQKDNKKEHKKPINPKIWIITSIVLGVFLVGAILFDKLYERPLITVDDDKYTLDDLTYYFYTVESSYDYINQLYGGSYWDMPANDAGTVSVRDAAKDEAINTALYYEIINKEVIAENYTLTKEENDQISTDITKLLYEQGLSDKMIKKNGFTGDYLTEMLTKTTLAKRYKQDKVDSFDIDDDGIKAGFTFEDYRQYDIEYLFVSTRTQDTAGNSVAMTEDEKKVAYDKINSVYEKAQGSEDWSTLIDEDEKELMHQKSSFLENDTNFDDDFEAMMMGMENDSISDIYETEDGYYIVRMLNNNSTESYDNVVSDAIKKAEDEAFQEYYETEILTKHTYKLHNNTIRNLKMGTITLAD